MALFSKWDSCWDGTEAGFKKILHQTDIELSGKADLSFSLTDVENELARWKREKIDIIHIFNENYPELLRQIYSPPPLFFAKGNIELLKRKKISIVGSREILPWVKQWLEIDLSQFFEKHQNLVSVSGGARGVDFCAHQAPLQQGASTIVVLPSGVLNPYPKSMNQYFSTSVNARTLWISEFSPDQPIRKYHFHQRNRIIAGLSQNLFVAQAGLKSGSMITARLALENDRDVYCLPMTPFDRQGAGNLKLLLDGAGLVRYAHDLENLI